jgi:hypothetical protein
MERQIIYKYFGGSKPKGLNMKTNIGYDVLYLREENLGFE